MKNLESYFGMTISDEMEEMIDEAINAEIERERKIYRMKELVEAYSACKPLPLFNYSSDKIIFYPIDIEEISWISDFVNTYRYELQFGHTVGKTTIVKFKDIEY